MKPTILMKTQILAQFLLVLEICNSQTTLSTDYPYLRNVKVGVITRHDVSAGIFTYNYTLHNDSTSSGSIEEFIIDISRSTNSMALDTTGLKFNGTFSEGHFRRRYLEIGNSIVPISFSSLPRHWLGLYGNALTASLSKDTLFVIPRESATGLVIMSRGLPGIRKFTVKPDFNIYEFFPDEEDTTSQMTQFQEDSILAAVNFHGQTVGPSAPPVKFIVGAFLDTLSSLVKQSYAFEWITSQTTANKYLSYFGSAKSSLQSNNISGVSATLQTVLKDVNVDSSRNLTNEAYALIRYNTEYLIAHLPLHK